MLKIISGPIRKLLNNFGYEIVKKSNGLVTKTDGGNWLEKLNIATIIDVGANVGQFSQAIGENLPGRKIIAFEPIKVCYDKLVINTKGLNITAFNYGLGSTDSVAEINISENFESSSFLEMETMHKRLYPQSAYVNTQKVEIKRLDNVLRGMEIPKNILLKIDVQGYEKEVLAGSPETLKQVTAVLVEFLYQPAYTGQWLFDDTYSFFKSNGFTYCGVLDQVCSKETDIPLFADAIFVRNEHVKSIY